MEINKDLNLVVPIIRGDVVLYAHSTPISKQVFESYHSVLAKAFSELTDGGLNITAALATASLALRDAAQAKGLWDGPAGVEKGFMNEIRRITQVFAPGDAGWETYILADAIKRDVIDEQEALEVENAIVFFTLASRMFRRHQVPMMLEALTNLGGLQTTSLGSTEYRDSLPTLTEIEISPNAAV